VDADRFLERQGSMHLRWAGCRGGRTIPTPFKLSPDAS
jgi:hypothetical protein